jgi:hypothetical protein
VAFTGLTGSFAEQPYPADTAELREQIPLEESAMAMQVKDQMCENVVRKMTTGEHLDEAEKSHLATCESCMHEIVRMLDEAAEREHGRGMTASATDDELTHLRPELKKALEHGRRVLEREFEIVLPEPIHIPDLPPQGCARSGVVREITKTSRH